MLKRTFGHLVKLALINAQTGLDPFLITSFTFSFATYVASSLHEGNKFSKGSDDL